jgi:hypothetical protein
MRNIKTLLPISSPQSGTGLETKAKIIPEKRVIKINSSLSHRNNLELVLDTKGKITPEKEC